MIEAPVKTEPITYVAAQQQQHMLLLFLPLKKGTLQSGVSALQSLEQAVKTSLSASSDTPDMRAQAGVHFFMIHGVADGSASGLPVPAFQTYPGKDLLVVMSLYDADFAPYIGAFVQQPAIAAGLNLIVSLVDETGIPGVDATGPLSAEFIRKNGGVVNNPAAFNCMLMRYNFADPTLPATGKPGATQAKYYLGATFPGLTVGEILQNYPNAMDLWPAAPADITYAKSVKPLCNQ